MNSTRKRMRKTTVNGVRTQRSIIDEMNEHHQNLMTKTTTHDNDAKKVQLEIVQELYKRALAALSEDELAVFLNQLNESNRNVLLDILIEDAQEKLKLQLNPEGKARVLVSFEKLVVKHIDWAKSRHHLLQLEKAIQEAEADMQEDINQLKSLITEKLPATYQQKQEELQQVIDEVNNHFVTKKVPRDDRLVTKNELIEGTNLETLKQLHAKLTEAFTAFIVESNQLYSLLTQENSSSIIEKNIAALNGKMATLPSEISTAIGDFTQQFDAARQLAQNSLANIISLQSRLLGQKQIAANKLKKAIKKNEPVVQQEGAAAAAVVEPILLADVAVEEMKNKGKEKETLVLPDQGKGKAEAIEQTSSPAANQAVVEPILLADVAVEEVKNKGKEKETLVLPDQGEGKAEAIKQTSSPAANQVAASREGKDMPTTKTRSRALVLPAPQPSFLRRHAKGLMGGFMGTAAGIAGGAGGGILAFAACALLVPLTVGTITPFIPFIIGAGVVAGALLGGSTGGIAGKEVGSVIGDQVEPPMPSSSTARVTGKLGGKLATRSNMGSNKVTTSKQTPATVALVPRNEKVPVLNVFSSPRLCR